MYVTNRLRLVSKRLCIETNVNRLNDTNASDWMEEKNQVVLVGLQNTKTIWATRFPQITLNLGTSVISKTLSSDVSIDFCRLNMSKFKYWSIVYNMNETYSEFLLISKLQWDGTKSDFRFSSFSFGLSLPWRWQSFRFCSVRYLIFKLWDAT